MATGPLLSMAATGPQVASATSARRHPARTRDAWVRRAACCAGMLACMGATHAQDASGDAAAGSERTVVWRSDDTTVRWHAQFGLNLVSERHLFWNLSDTVNPQAGFDPDQTWLEGYLKPGVSFVHRSGDLDVYGMLSGVGSFTRGTDAFDATDTGATTLEDTYLGLRQNGESPRWDVSLGGRELELGSGMLIANGGSSGFERGALKFGPRKAWRHAAIARARVAGSELTAFRIAPNELPSNDGHNRLAGLDARWDGTAGNFAGGTYIHVLESRSPYVQAAPGGIGPPTIIENGRHGTKALNLYMRATPHQGRLRNWFVSADLAIERNHRIDMRAWGGRAQAGYTFEDARWKPWVALTYKTFSGDNPQTRALERFDPLYYEGDPSTWSSGSKSSMVFINSNVRTTELAIGISPTPRDTLTLRIARLEANQLGSPLQFGQATRVVGSGSIVVSGVVRPHLSDDVFLQYSRVINPVTFLTAGLSASFPGDGIKTVAPGNTPDWVGAFVNVVLNY